MTRPGDAGQLVGYLAGPGRGNVHEQQRVIGGFERTGPLDRPMVRDVIQYLRAPGQAFPASVPRAGEFWHCSLSLKVGDVVPTDAQWKDIADDFMQGMGFDRDGAAASRWVVVGHGNSAAGNPHVHIAASTVREDGRVVDLYNHPVTGQRDGDWRRSQRECNRIEHERGLQVLVSRDAGVSRPGLSQTAFAQARKAGVEVGDVELIARRIAADPRVTTEPEFARRVREAGLRYKPYPKAGTPTGYSVQHPAAPKVWFTGGSMGRDMTLPKLKATWAAGGRVAAVRPSPAAWVAGTQELRALETRLRTGRMNVGQLADAAHSVSGLLAITAQKVDDPQVKQAARAGGRMAGPRKRHLPSQRHAVNTAMLLVMASDPTSTVGQSIMISQLMATFQAVQAAHHRMGLNRRRQRMSVETEMAAVGVTVAARAAEGRANRRAPAVPLTDHERRRELWDASTVRRDRTTARDLAQDAKVAAEWEASRARAATTMSMVVLPKMSTGEQIARMGELSRAVELDLGGVGVHLTQAEAASMIRDLENAAGPDLVARVDAKLAGPAYVPPAAAPSVGAVDVQAIYQEVLTERAAATLGVATPPPGTDCARVVQEMAAEQEQPVGRALPDTGQVVDIRAASAGMPEPFGLSPQQLADLRNTPKPVDQWRTGNDPIRPAQQARLIERGYTPAELEGMTKAVASKHITRDLSRADAQAAMGSRAAATARPADNRSSLPQDGHEVTRQREQQRRRRAPGPRRTG